MMTSKRMLTSVGAGSAILRVAMSIECFLRFCRASVMQCACGHVDGTILGTLSQINPRTIATYNLKSSSFNIPSLIFSLTFSLCLSLCHSLSLSPPGGPNSRLRCTGSHVEGSVSAVAFGTEPTNHCNFKKITDDSYLHRRVSTSLSLGADCR
jgi:hypothetical protein